MKHTFTALLLTTTAAHAGGLSDPIVTPPVAMVAPAESWTGPYARLSIGQRTTTTTAERRYHQRACIPGTRGKWIGKCTVSPQDHATSPELLALGAVLDGHPSNADSLDDPFRYDAGYPGVWVTETLVYTTTDDFGPARPSRYASNDYLGEFVETFDVTSDETFYAVGGGYRYDFGGAVGGIEAGFSENLTTLDLQVGLAADNLLLYGFAGVASSDDVTGATYGAGADLMIGQSWMVGAAYRTTDLDGTTFNDLTASVGVRF